MFLYFDESLIKWLQWGVRQIELLMEVRLRALFRGLIFFYVLAVVAYGGWFLIRFLFLYQSIFLVMHMLAITFFVIKLALLWPVIKQWLLFPIGYTLRSRRRGQRKMAFTCLLSFLGSLFVYAFLALTSPRYVFEWYWATTALFVPYLALEYTLCAEAVSFDELLRRQKER